MLLTTRCAKIIGCVGLAVVLVSCSSANKPQANKIPAFQQVTYSGAKNQLRLRVVRETAQSTGAQAGLAWQSKRYNVVLLQQKRYFDKIFNFQEIMLQRNILPPVLEEGDTTLNLANSATIRLADRVYKIVQPAKFVTTIPGWRDYLLMHYQTPAVPNASLLPRTNTERDLWNRYVTKGWKEGIAQAEEMFEENLNRLKRDFLGMILYKELLAQNIVTPPYFAKTNLGVTGNSEKIDINDQILRITAVSRLQPNSKLWISRLRLRKLPRSRVPPAHLMK